MDDTAALTREQVQSHLPLFEPLVLAALPADPPRKKPGQRGAPQQISWGHLWFRLIFCVMAGMSSYQDLRRDLASQPIGPFAPVNLSDDALIWRLKQAGTAPLLELFERVSQQLSRLVASQCPKSQLAPFAREVMALDETTWDAVQRRLKGLRSLPANAMSLRPGKLAARFNVRTQLWEFLQWRDNPLGNCKLDVCSLLEGLSVGTLVLFDLGYFSYAFLDYLSERGLWYVSRLREDAHYQLAHTFYRHEGTLDALVWLGTTGRNGSRCGQLVRLVRFWDGRDLRVYLTNQLDPCLFPLPEIARLYARRWDIELAFLTLKESLGLHHWWSALPILRQQQALLVLIVAQVLQATRMLIAAEQGCDPFDVSLPLLIRFTPRLLAARQHPVVWALTHGTTYDLFRPSSRFVVQVPQPPLQEYVFPSPDLPRTRLALYREYTPRPHRPAFNRTKSAAPPSSPPSATQLSLFSSPVLRRLKKPHT